MMYRVLAIIFLSAALLQPASLTAQDTKPESIDLREFVLNLEPDLKFSMGVERQNGELYLIIEMDHNPGRNSIVLTPEQAGIKPQLVGVARGNRRIGFNNDPFVLLPILEVTGVEGTDRPTRFISGSKEMRTQQKINLTEVVEALAVAGRLFDPVNGSLYKASDIEKVGLIVSEAKEGGHNKVEVIKFAFADVKESEVLQIKGEVPLSDIEEKSRYVIGDRVEVKVDFKVPAAGRGTHWSLQSFSSDGSANYKLVPMPKLGDKYSLPIEAAASFLPKAKKGTQWVKLSENNKRQVFQLVETVKLVGESVLARYVEAYNTSVKGRSKIEASLSTADFIKNLPFKVPKEFRSSVVKIITEAEPGQILPLLIQLQKQLPVAEVENAKTPAKPKVKGSAPRLCKSVFSSK